MDARLLETDVIVFDVGNVLLTFEPEKVKKATSLLESGEFTFDTFVVGESNKMAYAAARAVADGASNHYNPLFIYGDSGLGKTHLIYAIAHRSNGRLRSLSLAWHIIL